jgi:hypothetical protein
MCSNMINRISILFATAILLFAGCKKETKTTVPEIDGQWQVLNFAGVLSNEYYLFNSTNKTVYNLSKESGFEFRDYQKGVFNIKGNILEMSLYSTDLYSFSITNDTLTLTNAYSGSVKRALRSNIAPKTVDAWIKPATIKTEIRDSFSSQAITIYNGKIYSLISMEAKRIKIFDVNSLIETGSLNLTNEYTACEFVGPYLFTARKVDEKLERISELDGSVMATSGASGAFNYIRAMTFNGYDLVFASGYDFFTYDISASIFSNKPGPGDITEMAYYDGKLYTVEQGSSVIHQINASTLVEEKSWRLEHYRLDAIAFDGSNCWVHGTSSGSSFSKFMKIELQ